MPGIPMLPKIKPFKDDLRKTAPAVNLYATGQVDKLKEAYIMKIENATVDGKPVKVTPWSLGTLYNQYKNERLQELLSCKFEQFSRAKEYLDEDEKYIGLCNELKSISPEVKRISGKICDMMVSKEVAAFEGGYEAGIADFVTALTFNDLQITHTCLSGL